MREKRKSIKWPQSKAIGPEGPIGHEGPVGPTLSKEDREELMLILDAARIHYSPTLRK
jgi:hypothetical protein